MQPKLTAFLLSIAIVSCTHQLHAQQVLEPIQVKGMATAYRESIPDDAIIYNDSTGKRMTFREFSDLIRADPRGHHLIPVYNEYGRPERYRYRLTTKEERETGSFRDRDPALSPKPGQQMSPFVMKGTNGNEYRLADLGSKTVVLSFWVAFRPPFTNDAQINGLAKQLEPYLRTDELISLGITGDTAAQVANYVAAKPVPFVPVSNGRGFMEKYHLTQFPAILIINKTGHVVANLSGSEINSVGEILSKMK